MKSSSTCFLAKAALIAFSLACGASAQDEDVCGRIADAVSPASHVASSIVDLQYIHDQYHWATSSSQPARCTVEPGTQTDVSIILTILGETCTPFGVKGGGHTANANFSSTPGVLIVMSRFSEVTYNATSQTAVIGAGLIWDDVYAALTPHNVTVVGGRVPGVGVGGLILGGGYSWKTNQYGLTVDTIETYELVKPDGAIVNVTEASDPDLFFGLKGGLNNFGIITRFTLRTFPQGPVWGGPITYNSSCIPDVSAAIANFTANVTDPKAAIIATYGFILGQATVVVFTFYDDPEPPAGIFDSFLEIPALLRDAGTRDFLSLVMAAPPDILSAGHRAIFDTAPLVQYTPSIMKAIANESTFWGETLAPKSAFFLSHAIEAFLPSMYSHTSSPSAFPPNRTYGFAPFQMYFAWDDPAEDATFHDAIKQSARRIREVALREGQEVGHAAKYPNYAIYDTPLEEMYGDNVGKLRQLKERVDPHNVMGLAGGFKF